MVSELHLSNFNLGKCVISVFLTHQVFCGELVKTANLVVREIPNILEALKPNLAQRFLRIVCPLKGHPYWPQTLYKSPKNLGSYLNILWLLFCKNCRFHSKSGKKSNNLSINVKKTTKNPWRSLCMLSKPWGAICLYMPGNRKTEKLREDFICWSSQRFW